MHLTKHVDYAWQEDVLVSPAVAAGSAVHVKHERDERGEKAECDGGHENGGDEGGLCEPQVKADVYKGGEAATEEARDAMAEHEAPPTCNAKCTEDIGIARGSVKGTEEIGITLAVKKVVVEFVDSRGGAVEDFAGVAVGARDVDLAGGGGEGGDSDEEEDCGEGRTEAKEEA
ncbi:hypothetical protein C0992_003081 [Termitomyces sp. T32_za158]|nr:hypothetical protein C0992_003081 [Termitomyces sp. T32_za158]